MAEDPAQGKLDFRPATLADLALLRAWDEQPHVIASNPNDDWDWEEDLAWSPDWRELLLAEVDDRPVGVLQIIDPAFENTGWAPIGPGHRAVDVWIGEPDCLNRGIGTRMMRWAIARCFADDEVHTILIDPLATNTDAHRFYRRLGFEFVAERRSGTDDCFVSSLRR
ncbi:MAG: GNAT family N-acetyltransferase [Pseudomonadota bacterium]